EELLHDKVYLYLVTNKLDFNYEIYEYAKKSYLFKDNELEIFISNYDDKDSVTIIALNYWELKEHLNFPYKLDENYVVMTPINDREEIPTTKPPENKNKKLIAFTFDDGPSKYTLELLNILDEFNAKASFFLVGYNIRIRNEIVVEMFNRGFEIGNHTIDHSRLTAFNCEKANNKINQNNELFVNLTGNEMRLLRPPYGSINKQLRECIDHPVILWSVDSRDWETRNRDAVVHEVLSHVKEGDIVLFHDLYSTTIDAIKILLPILYADGFKVVSVSELFAAKNLPLEDHQIYRKAS
ncbi:MAG: polysaccharide deacetylase family protein, partial [Mollicutes bacterium]|nr:polysaccharide deacetylase family protein [Mollicutes bacterium]